MKQGLRASRPLHTSPEATALPDGEDKQMHAQNDSVTVKVRILAAICVAIVYVLASSAYGNQEAATGNPIVAGNAMHRATADSHRSGTTGQR